jgi:hypothetical protein
MIIRNNKKTFLRVLNHFLIERKKMILNKKLYFWQKKTETNSKMIQKIMKNK